MLIYMNLWIPSLGEVEMKPPVFDYLTPSSLTEAAQVINETPGAMIIAGGQSLIPALNFKLAWPSALIDIRNIPDLDTIQINENEIIVGAGVRHCDVEKDQRIGKRHPIMHKAMAYVAHSPIRNRGTVVGSICHADAAAEMPLILVLTDGYVTATSVDGSRTIAARDFFKFHMTTSRHDNEIIQTAHFPIPNSSGGYSFQEFARRSGDYAVAAIACLMTLDNSGKIEEVKIAGCGISHRPIRLNSVEQVVVGTTLTENDVSQAIEALAESVTSPDDIHATNKYRKYLAGKLLSKSLIEAKERAQKGKSS